MSLLDTKDYGLAFQEMILNILTTDPEIYSRCQNILTGDYFEPKLKPVVDYIVEYTRKHPVLPNRVDVKVKTGYQLEEVTGICKEHHTAFLEDIENFCRHKALELAIIEGMKLVQDKKYGKVESLIKDAMMVSLQKDIGTDYFLDPLTRNQQLASNQGTISTGWSEVDNMLFGGFGDGELEIFVAPSGGGKSVALQNLSINFSKRGLPGAYISLELKEELVANRMDSILTGRTKGEIFRNMEEAALDVQIKGKGGMGQLYVKRMPETITTVHDIKAYIKELQIRTGVKLQYLAVDYLDLLATPRAEASDVFNKDKFVCEELRALAFELGIVVITASQLNRSAVEEKQYNHSNIAGGISKIYTADNVIGIYTTALMKENGLMEFQFLKTRNSNGVGRSVKLAYKIDTLAISDLDEQTPNQSPDTKPAFRTPATDNKSKLQGLLSSINNSSL